jgi:DNA-directed RNA polymerase
MIGTLEQQIEFENQQKETTLTKYTAELYKAIESGSFDTTKEGQLLVKLGYLPFVKKIEEYFDDTNIRHRGQTLKDKNFIRLMCDDPKVLAFTVISSVVSGMGGKSRTVPYVSKKIMKDVQRLGYFNKLKEDSPKLHSYLGTVFRKASRKRKALLLEKHIKHLKEIDFISTGEASGVRIGSILLSLFIDSGANIVFIKEDILRKRKKGTTYQVSMTPEAQELLLKTSSRERILQSVNMLPLVVPPRPWESIKKGGYHTHQINFISTKSYMVKKFTKKKDLSKTISAVNKIQEVPWHINSEMLDLVQDVFEGNMIDPSSPATLPKLYGGLPTSEVYRATDFIKEEDYVEWTKFNRAREIQQIKLDAEASKRLSAVITLDIAHTVRDFDKIWFVYQVDYRGRVYPNVNFLNPQGVGYVKSILEFAEGKKLDDTGLYWLKVHIANVYGKDKLPFDERVKWTEENRQNILQVADAPLEYKRLWINADSPFEYVTACKAYRDAVNDKPVHLPIQLDATCSGIQFYSGLLLDKEGAEAVNVIGESRNDIYQLVADKVNGYLKAGDYPSSIEFKDSTGTERVESTHVEAKSLVGNVTRSMVKTNTMTVPYSVTMRGMSDQIWDVLDEAELTGKVFWKGDKWIVNKLLTTLNHRAIYEVVKGARQGQEYLKSLSSLLDEPAVWYTPLYNFPVFQPAFKIKKHRVRTPFGMLAINSFTEDLDKRKQSNKIAPNFIHSLDSTLLCYVADNIGTHIGVIHDCFLVHPNDGDKVRDQYKEGYVKLMECDPLSHIGKQLDPSGEIPQPNRGELRLEDVYNAQYIIS